MKIVAYLQVIFLLTNCAIFANDLSQNSQFKMPGRNISVEGRVRVIGRLENGATLNQAATRAGVHRVTVYGIYLRFLQTGSMRNRPKPGRPPKPGRLKLDTAVQDRFLRLTALRQRFKSSVKLTANLRRATGVAIHPRTVGNRLKSACNKPRRPCLRNKLTPRQKRESLAWCRHRRCWRRNQWGNILWSEESRFNVDFCGRRKRVWRSRRALYSCNHCRIWQVRRRQRFGLGGCELQPQNWSSHYSGKHDGVEIPWHRAYPNCTASCCSDWANVQYDNARPMGQDCYGLYPTAGTTDSTLTNKIAGSLTHRAAMGRVREENLRETHRYPHSSAAGATIMSGVAGNSLRNVFNSMRSRVKGCIDCNGGHTKYWVRYVINNENSCKRRFYSCNGDHTRYWVWTEKHSKQ